MIAQPPAPNETLLTHELHSEAEAPAHAQARTEIETEPQTGPGLWDRTVDKVAQTAVLLLVVKVVAAWGFVAMQNIEVKSRFAWGAVPYVGLRSSVPEFRNVVSWSTLAVVFFTVIWAGAHAVAHRRYGLWQRWAASSGLLMAAALTILEWQRTVGAQRLLETSMLVRILLVLIVAITLSVLGASADRGSGKSRTVQLPTRPNIAPAQISSPAHSSTHF